ncbi:MAG: CHC2 zinc finger domain-containing protein, partial [Candidatus Thermoplasmatota archaeon]
MIDPKALKAKIDLVAALRERGLKLKRVGSGYKALCPFHKEKTASFTVRPSKQTWKCFGCGASGDVFAFVMKQDGISFPEAARKLCPEEFAAAQNARPPKKVAPRRKAPAKVEPAPDPAPQESEPSPVDRPSQEVLDPITGHWEKMLGETLKAQECVKGRGLWAPKLLKVFRVGYSSGNLTAVLPADGKIRRQLAQVGILNRCGTEFFTNCLVFPIHDEAGVLVNVYGR